MARKLTIKLELNENDLKELEKIVEYMLKFSESVKLNFGIIPTYCSESEESRIFDNYKLLKNYFSEKKYFLEIRTESPDNIIVGFDRKPGGYIKNCKLIFRERR